MIEAEQVKHRRVQIVDAGTVLDRLESKLIRRAMNRAALHATARQPHAETVVVVITAELGLAGVPQFHGGRAAKFPAPENQGVLKHAALFEIGHERRDRAVDLGRMFADVALDVVVVIPRLPRAVPELHEAHAALQQPPRDERLPSMHRVAIYRANARRFVANVEGIGRLKLHAERQLERLDARIKLRIAAAGALVAGVEFSQKVKLAALHRGRRVRAADVLDEFLHLAMLRVHERALECAGQESRLPVFGILDRHPARTHRHEAGQVLILCAQTVERPRAEARTRLHAVTAVHQHQRRLVIRHLRIHRAHDRDVVRVGRGPGEEFANFQSAPAVFGELERRRKRRAGLALRAQIFAGQRLTCVLRE